MRHVVLGANSFVGQFVIKLLVTVGEKITIIAVSTDGSIARDIPAEMIEIETGTVLDPLSLYYIFEKGDIVYNAEVYFEEDNAELDVMETTNHLGLVNLLGIASISGITRIVSFLPQLVGWDVPKKIDETSNQLDSDAYQMTSKNTLKMVEDFWKRKDYGWNSRNIRAWAKQNIESLKYPITFYPDEELGYDPSSKVETEELTLEPKISDNKPNLSSPPKLSGPSPPNLSSPPKLSSSPKLNDVKIEAAPAIYDEKENIAELSEKASIDKNAMETEPESLIDDKTTKLESEGLGEEVTEELEEKELTPTELFWKRQREETERRKAARLKIEAELANIRSERDKKDELERELKKRELPRVPLVLARFGRIFGAYDKKFSLKLCDSVKRGKIEIIGEMDQPISWITPVDIGRAMIILGDKSVPQGQYMLNSFTASPIEIINELDRINASKTKIIAKHLDRELQKLKIKNFLSKYGISKNKDTQHLLKYNVRQVFSDEKARKRWKWYPRYDFVKACEDAFQWYFEVMVPELYPLN